MRKLAFGKCVFVLIAGSISGWVGAAPMLYVSDTLASSVKIIDTATNTIVGDPITILAPLVPIVSPDGKLVYVQSVSGPIFVIDAATRSVVRTFDDPNPTAVDGPATMTLSPDGRVLYVIGTGDAGIALVDTNTGSVTARIPATGIASPSPLIRISHDGRHLYVLDAASLAIAAVDVSTRTVTGEVIVPTGGGYDSLVGIVVAADDQTLFGITYYGNLVSIDAASMTVTSTIAVGPSLYAIDLSPDGSHALLGVSSENSCLDNVDLATGQTTATSLANNMCFAVAAGRDGRHVYVANYDVASNDYSIVVFDTSANSVVATFPGFSYINFDNQSMGPASSITPEPGTWWNPAESGRSFMIEVRHGTLVLVATVYDQNGAPIWVTASGPYDATTSTFSGSLGSYSDGQCLGCPYSPPVYTPVTGGEVRLVFSSATTGTLTFDGIDTSIQKFEW